MSLIHDCQFEHLEEKYRELDYQKYLLNLDDINLTYLENLANWC